MAFDAHKNLAYSTVATAPSPADTGTSLVVSGGHGTRFPAVPFNATVWPAGAVPTPANAEIVRVTAISTDTLTITRAQEGTTARSIVVGDQIAATITALVLTALEDMWNPGKTTQMEFDGYHGLQTYLSGAGASAQVLNAENGRPGLITRFNCGTANPGKVAGFFSQNSNAAMLAWHSGTPFELLLLFKLDAGTDRDVRLGFSSDLTSATPNDGLYLEALAADTNWFLVFRKAATQTRSDTGKAVDRSSTIHKYRLTWDGTTLKFAYDGAADVSYSDAPNTPSVTGNIFLHSFGTGVNRVVDLDYAGCRAQSLSR